MEDDKEQLVLMSKIGLGSLMVAGILILIIVITHNFTKKRSGEIVLPAGGTYLGPSATPAPAPARFTADASAQWVEKRGNVYPYSFSAPETLTLTTFPDDPYDIYAISWNATNPSSNVLIGVEDLNKVEARKPFVKKSKKEYIETFWWKQFGLTGVSTISEFTNPKGLRGYKVKFSTSGGLSPYDDVFLEVKGKPNIVIHMSNMILPPEVFDKIVESVGWK